MVSNHTSPNTKNAHQSDDADEVMPDPPGLRFLKFAVSFMGILLVAGFGFLVYTLVMRASTYEPESERTAGPAQVSLQQGEKVKSVSLDGSNLLMHITKSDGSEAVVIFNVRKQEVISRVEIVSGQAN